MDTTHLFFILQTPANRGLLWSNRLKYGLRINMAKLQGKKEKHQITIHVSLLFQSIGHTCSQGAMSFPPP